MRARHAGAVASALAFFLWWPLNSFADGQQIQAYVETSSKLQNLMKEYAGAGGEPSQERISLLLSRLTDQDIFLAARSTEDPLKSLMAVCGAATAAQSSLVLFGLANSGINTSQPREAAALVIALAERNALKFQDGIFPLTTFLTTCFAIALPQLSRFTQELPPEQLTPIRREGLAQTRNGMEEMFTGALLSLAEPRFDEKLRFTLADALATRAPIYAESLPRERRVAVLRTAKLVLARVSPAFRLNLLRVIDAMSSDQCNTLCAS